jgi:DNA mismatch repair protein MutS2
MQDLRRTEYKNLDWFETLEKIKNFSTSQKGKDIIAETKPFAVAADATQQAQEIFECKTVVTLDFRPRLDSVDFFFPWFERLKRKAVLKVDEFQEVRRFCYDIFNLQKTLSTGTTPWLKRIASELMDTSKIHSAIDQIITFEGAIRTDASETLHSLYNEKKTLERQIRTTLDKFVKTNEMENLLQDRYVTNREGRWVLPIRSGKQHQFDGIIHDSSQTKQTVFMEPKEVIAINNRLKEVEGEIEKEIERLLTQLTHFVSQSCPDLERCYHHLLICDQRLAQAQFALKTDSQFFEFSQDEFFLHDVRHPLLSFQDSKKVVPNNLGFDDEKRILILSGPNAGGKTVLLKAIGLTCHMARCGLLIPANSESKIPFFKNIFVTIGDTQSVGEHMSTFAAHLKTLSAALETKGRDQLILVDEICGSTDPEEGAAIAKSFIEHYAENEVYGIITSHLGPLKQVWPKESPVICGSMEYLDHPTYKLFMGIHGRSFAIKTAKSVGVPETIIQKAMSYLSTESRQREEKLDELDKYKEQVVELSKKLETESQMAEVQKNKYKDLVRRFEIEKNTHLQKAIERAEKKLEKIVEDFRANPSISKARAQFPEVVKSTGLAPPISSVEEFSKQFPAGSSAFITSLGQDGIIQGTPNAKGEVPVLSRSMRMQIHWKDLRTAQTNPVHHPIQQNFRKQVLHRDEMEIDIRGMSADQAVEELEKVFDKAMQDQIDRVKIIHGHGTEALKKSIRKYLSRSVYIQKWQAGGEVVGSDDGITWAELS